MSEMPLVLPRVRRLDACFQGTKINCYALRDILDVFFIQQVQLGVQIKGDSVVFVLMNLITLITNIACRINEVFVFV
ncbi:Uncharacterised protein [Neisseria meningitidis]|nr:Uncharacterised protein [Neisseria meningitidis]CEZ52509.1 Uncharacterised protein [Neisseria meningitidis]CFA11828.1 Uncharacterised protein [Neisseria meningitidis]CFA97823.1 Uncharacterised protein [Neisseria meningitidis]CFB01420.1 Uncharacterised protein [Neisseria meningitidis]